MCCRDKFSSWMDVPKINFLILLERPEIQHSRRVNVSRELKCNFFEKGKELRPGPVDPLTSDGNYMDKRGGYKL